MPTTKPIDLTFCDNAGEHVDTFDHTPTQCPHPEPKCIERGDGVGQPEGADCTGPTEYRESLSGTGTRIPRCAGHWSKRLDREQELRQRYPEHAPADFDPTYAGESWDEDGY